MLQKIAMVAVIAACFLLAGVGHAAKNAAPAPNIKSAPVSGNKANTLGVKTVTQVPLPPSSNKANTLGVKTTVTHVPLSPPKVIPSTTPPKPFLRDECAEPLTITTDGKTIRGNDLNEHDLGVETNDGISLARFTVTGGKAPYFWYLISSGLFDYDSDPNDILDVVDVIVKPNWELPVAVSKDLGYREGQSRYTAALFINLQTGLISAETDLWSARTGQGWAGSCIGESGSLEEDKRLRHECNELYVYGYALGNQGPVVGGSPNTVQGHLSIVVTDQCHPFPTVFDENNTQIFPIKFTIHQE